RRSGSWCFPGGRPVRRPRALGAPAWERRPRWTNAVSATAVWGAPTAVPNRNVFYLTRVSLASSVSATAENDGTSETMVRINEIKKDAAHRLPELFPRAQDWQVPMDSHARDQTAP